MLKETDFKSVSIEDMKIYEPILKNANRQGNEYSFVNLFAWSNVFNTEAAQIGDTIILKFFMDNHVSFLFPIGDKNVVEAVEEILNLGQNYDYPTEIIGIDNWGKSILEEYFPHKFEITVDRDNFDYIYNTEDLANLKGRPYSSKRNHISKFVNTFPNWKYETITKENIDNVRKMNKEWFTLAEEDKEESIGKEKIAVQKVLDNYEQLNLVGGLIKVDTKVVAYTLGSKINNNTFDVHFEKALPGFRDAYPLINQNFVKNELGSYRYVNREDDAGVEGLRQAKMSYRPKFLYEKYIAKEIR